MNKKESLNCNKTEVTGMLTGSRDRNRELVRIRDKHTCRICGRVWKQGERRFDIHHKDCDNTKSRKADNLKDEWNNLITLCHKCHLSLPEHKKTMSEAQRLITKKPYTRKPVKKIIKAINKKEKEIYFERYYDNIFKWWDARKLAQKDGYIKKFLSSTKYKKNK